MGQLAAAIGRKNFPDTAEFMSATPGGSEPVSETLRGFLQETGLPDEGLDSERLEALEHDFSDFIVIVCLSGQVSDHIQKVPFHTSAMNWALPEGEGLAGQYRQLRNQIIDLVTLLAGEEVTQA
jgi:protein-tyrosine-phosphatase